MRCRRRRSRTTGAWLLGLLSLGQAELGHGQGIGVDPDRDRPRWLTTWSPVAARADLPRRLPGAGLAVPALLLPAPRAGLFWTAGNPAGLAAESLATRSDFTVALARQDGALRRPLDAGEVSLQQFEASGWGSVTPRLTLIGRVAVDGIREGTGSESLVTDPYRTSPFVATDTTTNRVRRLGARLEGGAGLRVGQWRLGAALGYDTRDFSTIEAAVVRQTRQVLPGAVLGVAYPLGGLDVGVHGRWRGRAETIEVSERAGETVVHELRGYADPKPLPILNYYYRRVEETVTGLGAGLSGKTGRGRWTAYLERAGLRERLTRQEQNDPAADRWYADGWQAGAALVVPVAGMDLSANLHWSSLRGDGDLVLDSAGVVFTAAERSTGGTIELRRATGSAWSWLVRFGLATATWERRDSVAQVFSRVRLLEPSAGFEIARRLGSRVSAVAMVETAHRKPESVIPKAIVMGPTYRRLLAPEMDLAARASTAWAGSFTLRWLANSGSAVWASGRLESARASDSGPSGLGAPLTRTSVGVLVGVTLTAAGPGF